MCFTFPVILVCFVILNQKQCLTSPPTSQLLARNARLRHRVDDQIERIARLSNENLRLYRLVIDLTYPALPQDDPLAGAKSTIENPGYYPTSL